MTGPSSSGPSPHAGPQWLWSSSTNSLFLCGDGRTRQEQICTFSFPALPRPLDICLEKVSVFSSFSARYARSYILQPVHSIVQHLSLRLYLQSSTMAASSSREGLHFLVLFLLSDFTPADRRVSRGSQAACSTVVL